MNMLVTIETAIILSLLALIFGILLGAYWEGLRHRE